MPDEDGRDSRTEEASGQLIDQATTPTATAPGVPYEKLREFMAEATGDGLFPAVAYGLDPRGAPQMIGLLTTSIADFPLALDLAERVTNETITPGRFVPLQLLVRIAERNAIMKLHRAEVAGLDSNNREHRQVIIRLMSHCTASRYKNRAFALVDMVDFSLYSTAEQLSLRMSLGQTVNQCIKRMYQLSQRNLVLLDGFDRISTGDGFYIWSYDPTSEGHVSTFLLMVLLMAQSEALRTRFGNPLQLKAAFAIGEAYIFPYHGPSVPPPQNLNARFMPDAIGPVLNDLSRLLSAAYPGQILVAPFEEPGRHFRQGERLNLPKMLERIRAEILPGELKPDDRIGAAAIELVTDPAGPLSVTDKHKQVHHCYNVYGRIPNRSDELTLQSIGVIRDEAHEVETTRFRTH